MLSGLNKTTNTNQKDCFNHNIEYLIALLIETERYTEAYILLLQQDHEEDVSSVYNKALCLFFVNKYNDTVILLDSILEKLSLGLPNISLKVDNNYKEIFEKQCQKNTYKKAVTNDYIQNFPDFFKDSIMRLKIDCYLKLELWNKVIQTATPLQNKNYINVNEAINIAKSKL